MRSYDLSELAEHSALSRRTISDYVSRGLLSGPSHRGRGARYSQRDFDALQVIPLLRTVLKSEFSSLNAVREFLDQLSQDDLTHLAGLPDERNFEIEVRRKRVHGRLRAILPSVAANELAEVLNGLNPDQICGVDSGRYQIGSLVDFERLSNAGAGAPAESKWERFGTPTVEVRIEKRVLGDRGADMGITNTILDFAKQIESLLKASG